MGSPGGEGWSKGRFESDVGVDGEELVWLPVSCRTIGCEPGDVVTAPSITIRDTGSATQPRTGIPVG